MDKKPLKELGMTNNEIEVYLSLLGSGDSPVNEIASRTGLHRQVCYDALERLTEKGFVRFVLTGNRKIFSVANPETILDYIEEKRERIQAILPGLIALQQKKKEETHVEVLKGKNVLRIIYKDIFSTMKEKNVNMHAMGVDELKFLNTDEITIRQYINKIRKHGLKEKLLSKESAKFFFEGTQSEYRLIPDELFNPNPTHVYGDKVAIIIWGKPMHGIIIRNKEIADANRKYFMMMWKTAKPRVIHRA